MRKPVTVFMEAYSEFDIVAKCHEFDEWGFGDTVEESVKDLKLSIIDLYDDLNDIPNNKLGQHLYQIKRRLNDIIYKKDWSKVDCSLKRTLTAQEIKEAT